MGYSEVGCQICGVSFNIGRIRRPDEPRTAAWSRHGFDDYVRNYAWEDDSGDCLGCQFTVRPEDDSTPARQDGNIRSPSNVSHDTMSGMSDVDRDVMHLLHHSAVKDKPPNERTSSEGSEEDRESDSSDEDGTEQLQYIQRLGYDEDEMEQSEHIAGPSCGSSDGYNGHSISVREMLGCATSQCLVQKSPPGKPSTFQPEPDDEDFERSSPFFLSGLNDHMPSRDMPRPIFHPTRHDCMEPHAENYLWEEEAADDYAMPFHPSCLEVYKRASRRRTGKVDLEGLTLSWALGAYDDVWGVLPIEQSADVRNCADQMWAHDEGTEYLSAHPLLIPMLPGILQQAVATDPLFDLRQAAFAGPKAPSPTHARDPFASLPNELRLLILNSLPSRSIAALRLASRSFHQLPQTLFHDLLQKEKPWFWELWCQTPYSHWSTTTALEIQGPIAARALLRALSVQPPVSTADPAHAVHSPFALPPHQTNYYLLYTLLTRHLRRGELKGLRNRERIWRDCEQILRRAEVYRQRGLSATLGVRGAIRESKARQLAQRDGVELGSARVGG